MVFGSGGSNSRPFPGVQDALVRILRGLFRITRGGGSGTRLLDDADRANRRLSRRPGDCQRRAGGKYKDQGPAATGIFCENRCNGLIHRIVPSLHRLCSEGARDYGKRARLYNRCGGSTIAEHGRSCLPAFGMEPPIARLPTRRVSAEVDMHMTVSDR